MQKPKQKNKRTAIIYWFFTIGYMGIIFYISSSEKYFPSGLPEGSDKVLHMGAYAILAFLSYLSFRKSGVNKYVFLLSFVFAAIYGISDELHQFYVPGRDASLGDILADFIGAFLGSYLASMASVRRI